MAVAVLKGFGGDGGDGRVLGRQVVADEKAVEERGLAADTR